MEGQFSARESRGQHPPVANTVEKANRDVRYASLLASMQNTQWSQACRQSAKLAEPSADAIYNAYSDEGPDSTAMSSATAVAAIYYLWSFPQDRGALNPLDVGNTTLIQECQEAR